jgi:hypothetical protein
LSRLFTTLNLLPTMAVLAVARRPISRQSSTKRADLARLPAIVFAEVRHRLAIRSEPTQQPHELDIASGLSFQPSARPHRLQRGTIHKGHQRADPVRAASGFMDPSKTGSDGVAHRPSALEGALGWRATAHRAMDPVKTGAPLVAPASGQMTGPCRAAGDSL